MNRKSLKSEILKCGHDPDYFIRNYVKIEHPIRGLIPFALFDYQSKLLSDYKNNRFNIVNKARQLGISETSAAYALWMMLFRRNKNIVVLATKKETAKNIIRKVKTGLSNLPVWLILSKTTSDNVFSIEFANGSRIKAVSTAKDAGRSEAGSLLIIDEAAHIENMEEIWTGLRPVVTAGGSVIMLSSPKGVGNIFYKLCAGAIENENEFRYTELMWWLHPEHITNEEGLPDLDDDPLRPGYKTSSWFRNETSGMDPREIAQEYECNFNASGDTFIANEYLKIIEDSTIMPPISFEGWDRNIYVWNKPTLYTQYFIAADVARGDGKDFSTAQVFDVSTMTQCAEYRGKVPPDRFAELLIMLGEEYNKALLIVENNSVGLACLEHIKLGEYEQVYFSSKGDFRPGKIFNAMMPLPSMSDYIPGFTTSNRTRPLMLQKLEEYVRLQVINIRSTRLLDELRKFAWNGGRPEAQKGCNDDLVMACALGCWIRDTFLSSSITSTDITKALMNSMSIKRLNHTDIPGAAKDPKYIKSNEALSRSTQTGPNRYSLTLPDGSIENIGWLLGKK